MQHNMISAIKNATDVPFVNKLGIQIYKYHMSVIVNFHFVQLTGFEDPLYTLILQVLQL